MVALMKVYEEEDEAYQDLVTMATQFYQYLLQPFRDMRELATLCKLEILVGSVFMKCTGYIVRVRHHFVLPSFAFTCFCFFFPPVKPTNVTEKCRVEAELLSEDLSLWYWFEWNCSSTPLVSPFSAS